MKVDHPYYFTYSTIVATCARVVRDSAPTTRRHGTSVTWTARAATPTRCRRQPDVRDLLREGDSVEHVPTLNAGSCPALAPPALDRGHSGKNIRPLAGRKSDTGCAAAESRSSNRVCCHRQSSDRGRGGGGWLEFHSCARAARCDDTPMLPVSACGEASSGKAGRGDHRADAARRRRWELRPRPRLGGALRHLRRLGGHVSSARHRSPDYVFRIDAGAWCRPPGAPA